MPLRTHEDVEHQLHELMITVNKLVPELSFLELRVFQDEEDYRRDPDNYMRIIRGKTVECNTLGELKRREERTKDDFLHECGHALFYKDGEAKSLVPLYSLARDTPKLDEVICDSDRKFHELGAEVFAHLRFSESLNFGEARGKDTVHHFYNAATCALWSLYEGLKFDLKEQDVTQVFDWARLVFKHYISLPCRPNQIPMETELLEFIGGKDMVFPEDRILPTWEEE